MQHSRPSPLPRTWCLFSPGGDIHRSITKKGYFSPSWMVAVPTTMTSLTNNLIAPSRTGEALHLEDPPRSCRTGLMTRPSGIRPGYSPASIGGPPKCTSRQPNRRDELCLYLIAAGLNNDAPVPH